MVVQDLSHAPQEGIAIADVGTAHMQRFVERRWSAIDGQIGFAADGLIGHKGTLNHWMDSKPSG
jgi:hypothetical protein